MKITYKIDFIFTVHKIFKQRNIEHNWHMTNLRLAKNGGGDRVMFGGKQIYYSHTDGCDFSILGSKQNKETWIKQQLKPEYNDDMTIQAISNKLLVDWELYENGWIVSSKPYIGYKDSRLLYAKCQIGNRAYPTEIKFFKE